ncbi:MAG TPA: hypothetical protein VJ822_13400 [Dongiaceae bacterium]|nr:hypothetical protein [Dongiaceae bacterium]
MFDPARLVAEALDLADTYDRRFGGREPDYAEFPCRDTSPAGWGEIIAAEQA